MQNWYNPKIRRSEKRTNETELFRTRSLYGSKAGRISKEPVFALVGSFWHSLSASGRIQLTKSVSKLKNMFITLIFTVNSSQSSGPSKSTGGAWASCPPATGPRSSARATCDFGRCGARRRCGPTWWVSWAAAQNLAETLAKSWWRADALVCWYKHLVSIYNYKYIVLKENKYYGTQEKTRIWWCSFFGSHFEQGVWLSFPYPCPTIPHSLSRQTLSSKH